MDLLTVIIVLILVGFALWAINTYIPLQAGIKKLLNIVVIIAIILWLLKLVGAWQYLQNIKL